MTVVAKEFHRLMKRIKKATDGQATITDINWDDGNLRNFYVLLIPNAGPYKSGQFKFEINVLDGYPDDPPVVWCHTEIYHPNIDCSEYQYDVSATNVCLNLLENGTWNRSYGIEGAVLGLLFLMHHPNLEDPLSPYFDGSDDHATFIDNVKKYMAGEKVDDWVFNTDFCVKDGILTEKKVSQETVKFFIEDTTAMPVDCVHSKSENSPEFNALAGDSENADAGSEILIGTKHIGNILAIDTVDMNDLHIDDQKENNDAPDDNERDDICSTLKLIDIDGEYVIFLQPDLTINSKFISAELTDKSVCHDAVDKQENIAEYTENHNLAEKQCDVDESSDLKWCIKDVNCNDDQVTLTCDEAVHNNTKHKHIACDDSLRACANSTRTQMQDIDLEAISMTRRTNYIRKEAFRNERALKLWIVVKHFMRRTAHFFHRTIYHEVRS